jgi:hypothetical protein
VYALIAAHIAHLILNWGNDSVVMVQRMSCISGRNSSRGEKNRKPHFTLPASGLIRWFRLFVAALILFMTLQHKPCHSNSKDTCALTPTDVSHATHFFGAVSGLLTGCIFLQARNLNSRIELGKKILLTSVYGLSIGCVIVKFYDNAEQVCPWMDYEWQCQNQCYLRNLTNSRNCNVSLCMFPGIKTC